MTVSLFALLLLAATPQIVVAVADFEVANDRELAPLGKGMAEMLITDLSVSDAIRLVERARLREVLNELALQKSPFVDQTSAAKLGRGLGAELIVTGQIFSEAGALRADVRAIDVESGAIAWAGKVAGRREEIFELERKLAIEVLGGLGAKLSPIAGKQLGKQGTKSFDALLHYGAALDAEDRGAREEIKKELSLALKSDPEFGRVKDRLSALEERVGTLEKSGGLILKPTSWRDHLHNFKEQRARADLDAAGASLAKAIELEPRRAELWTAYVELPLEVRTRAVGEARALDAVSKQLLLAHVSLDLGAFHAAPESAENPALRSVLAIDLVGRRLGAFTLIGAIELARACAYVLESKNRRFVEPMLVDTEAFFSLAKKLQTEKLAGRDSAGAAIEHMLELTKLGSAGAASSAWYLELHLVERPAGSISVSVARVPLPSGEKPYPNDGLWVWEHSKPEDPARLAALRSGEAYGWIVYGEDDPFSKDVLKGFSAFGASFEIPAGDRFMACEAAGQSPVGLECTVLFTLDKRSMPPGPWALEVRYRDGAGAEVKHSDPHFWISETSLAEFRTGLWHHSDAFFLINPVDDTVRSRMDPGAKNSPMAVRACANPPLARDVEVPVVLFYYDVDFKLRGAKKSYRDAIVEKGASAKPLDDRACGYLPLSKLAPGKHTLCVVTSRKNGSLTLEPECTTTEVPVRYPQEGRN